MGLKLHKVPQFKKSSTVVMSPGLDDDQGKPGRKASKSNNHVIGIWSHKDQIPSE
jgi:hypothetical protein